METDIEIMVVVVVLGVVVVVVVVFIGSDDVGIVAVVDVVLPNSDGVVVVGGVVVNMKMVPKGVKYNVSDKIQFRIYCLLLFLLIWGYVKTMLSYC
jgi:hypothetical protein